MVRRDECESTLVAAAERAGLEEEKRLRLAAGELGLDIYKMRERLEAKGLRYVDNIEDLEG
ncbi:4-carboxy-4-hydroxy-2-oxoadipate aldolase [Pseudomonas sp. XWY-1]|nr:4-carboxy-4-hydroxy-2-oxoadipate aldolase [Pseudomonas sp. XWY-1]